MHGGHSLGVYWFQGTDTHISLPAKQSHSSHIAKEKNANCLQPEESVLNYSRERAGRTPGRDRITERLGPLFNEPSFLLPVKRSSELPVITKLTDLLSCSLLIAARRGPVERKPTQGVMCPSTNAIGLITNGLKEEVMQPYQDNQGLPNRLSDLSRSQPALACQRKAPEVFMLPAPNLPRPADQFGRPHGSRTAGTDLEAPVCADMF